MSKPQTKETVRLEVHLPRTGQAQNGEWLGRRFSPTRPLFSTEPAPPPANDRGPEIDIEAIRRQAEAEGLRAAQNKIEALAQKYLEGIHRLEEAARGARRPDAGETVELAMIIARAIVGHELTLDRQPMIAAVDNALRSVRNEPLVVVRLCAADLQYLRRHRPELIDKGVLFVEDPRLTVGGCQVETTQRLIDASIEARMETVRDAMEELLAEQEAAAGEPSAPEAVAEGSVQRNDDGEGTPC